MERSVQHLIEIQIFCKVVKCEFTLTFDQMNLSLLAKYLHKNIKEQIIVNRAQIIILQWYYDEESCDTEDCSNDSRNQLYHPKTKKHLQMHSYCFKL